MAVAICWREASSSTSPRGRTCVPSMSSWPRCTFSAGYPAGGPWLGLIGRGRHAADIDLVDDVADAVELLQPRHDGCLGGFVEDRAADDNLARLRR